MIYDVLEKLGRWDVALVDAPVELVDALDYFGHLVVLEGNIDDIDTRGDELLGAALYAGPMRRRLLKSPDELHLAGAGMALWLGDEDGKASTVFVNGETFAAETFAQTIRDLLPGTVTEGTLYSVAGSYTGTHQYQSPREAIDYVAGVFDAHWRVNADFTLDAGAASDLFVTTPEAIIVRRPSGAGGTIGLNDAAGTVTTDQDVRDYTTDVLLLGAVDGADVVSGVAQTASGSIPYKNPQGNTLNLTRVVREAETAGGNATARAQLALNRFANPRKAITLTADDYELIGVVAPGDTVYVYDPDAGLIDTANEVDHNGELIHPLALQVIALEYPLRQGLTVAYRTGAGAWLDLTPYVEWEEAGAGANITVGAYPRTIGGAASIYGGVKDATATTTGDAAIPAAPTLTTPFTTGTYIDATGATVAYIVADWAQPLNTDASTIVDGSYYEVHIQRAGASDWSPHFAGWDTTELELQGLANGEDYDVRVRAVDLAGNVGAWSTTETTTAAPDTVPPSTPSTPTVAGNPLAIQVIHNLDKAAGGDLELDVDYLEVHSAAASGFTPSASTMLGRLQVGAGAIALGIDVLETFAEPVSDGTARWVKVIAVDRSGNASTASAAATVTADLIATANIDDLAVTTAKIATLEVNKLVAGSGIVADLTIAASGSMQSANYTPGATGAGWQIDDTAAILNDVTVRGTLDGVTGTLGALTISGQLDVEDAIELGTGGVLRTAASGHRAEFNTGTFSHYGTAVAGLELYGNGPATEYPGYVGVKTGGADGTLVLSSPSNSSDTDRVDVELESDTTGGRLLVKASVINLEGGPDDPGDTALTVTGPTNLDGFTHVTHSANEILRLERTGASLDSGYIGFYDGATTPVRLGYVGYLANDNLYLNNQTTNGDIEIRAGTAGEIYIRRGATTKIEVQAAAVLMPDVYANTTADAVNMQVHTNGSLRRSTSTWDIKDNVELLAENGKGRHLLRNFRHLMPVYFDSLVDEHKPHLGFVHQWSHGLLAGNPANEAFDVHAYLALTVAKVQELEARLEQLGGHQ